jgi:hypothetical protein
VLNGLHTGCERTLALVGTAGLSVALVGMDVCPAQLSVWGRCPVTTRPESLQRAPLAKGFSLCQLNCGDLRADLIAMADRDNDGTIKPFDGATQYDIDNDKQIHETGVPIDPHPYITRVKQLLHLSSSR